MKFIKGVCSFILKIFLFILLILTGVSFGVKGVFYDLVLDVAAEEVITTEFDNIEDSENFSELLKNDEVKKLVNIYIDDMIESIVSNKDSSKDLEKDIVDFVNNNRDFIEEEYQVEITDEFIIELEKELDNNNLNNEYEEIKNELKYSMDEDEISLIKIYNYITSDSFKILLFVLIVGDLFLIAILQKSYYKWIKSLGITSIISGIITTIFGIFIDYIINIYIKETASSFELSSFTKYSIGMIVFGILSIIIYTLINKKIFNNKILEDEISLVS